MTNDAGLGDDVITACANLAERAGARNFEVGYVHEDVPVEEAGWYAHVTFVGARIIAENHTSPGNAALELAQKLLTNGLCRCGQRVTLTDFAAGCRWRLVGPRWEPSCDTPLIRVTGGDRGNVAAMKQALDQQVAQRGKRESRRRRRR